METIGAQTGLEGARKEDAARRCGRMPVPQALYLRVDASEFECEAVRRDTIAGEWVLNRRANCELSFDVTGSPGTDSKAWRLPTAGAVKPSRGRRQSDPAVWKLHRSPAMCRALLQAETSGLGAEYPPAFRQDVAEVLAGLGHLQPRAVPGSEDCVLVANPAQPLRFVITAAVDGGMPRTRLHRPKYAHTAMKVLEQGLAPSVVCDLSKDELRFLLRSGLLVRPEEELPSPAVFARPVTATLFSEVPPARLAEFRANADAATDLMLSGDLYLTRDEALPPSVARHADRLALRLEAAPLPDIWIERPERKAAYPYWLTPADRSALQGLRRGACTCDALDPETRLLLVSMGALARPSDRAARAERWRSVVRRAGASLERDQCFVLLGLIDPLFVACIRSYVRTLFDAGALCHDEIYDTAERYWIPDDPVTELVEAQIADLLNLIVPDKVQPAYGLLTVNRPGSVLPKHIDQQLMCNYAFSALVDEVASAGATPWPLYAYSADGRKITLELEVGDGALFRPGNFHGRDGRLDHRMGLMILAFVPTDYRGFVNASQIGFDELDQFDRKYRWMSGTRKAPVERA